ncbi:MAG TPA: hypothetical protein VEK15_29315 [Vicinamibacteria bacterium]|nr:hypothetical protein [Vicinamibacteria bacterium]
MEAREPASRRVELVAAAILFLTGIVVGGFGVQNETVTFRLGPNDHRFIQAFASHYELEDGDATRWTTYHSRVVLPLAIEGGPVEVFYRFARVFGETAQVEVTLDGRIIDRFEARGGAFETRSVRLPVVAATPVDIGFDIDSHERRNLGLKLDAISIGVGPQGRIRLHGVVRWLPAVLTVFLFALFRWGGLRLGLAFALGLGFVALVVVAAEADVYALAYALTHLAAPLLVLSAGATLTLRRRPLGSWVVPIFVFGYLLRGGGLFHPSTFYPDVANARDYVEAFRETEGSLAERGVETQERTNVGYPRTVAGKDYAFPYSPLYFLPFGLAGAPGAIEDAVRHAGLAASVLEVLPLFWLVSAVLSPRAGVLASLVWMMLPALFSRLLLALHATLVGNLLDTLVIVAILALSHEPRSLRRLAAVFGTMLASLLVYTSSLISVSAFVVVFSMLERKLALRLVGVLAITGLITVSWLYWPFLVAFLTEIVPAVASGRPGVGEGSGAEPVRLAVSRIPLFYGYGYPVLSILGLLVARRRADRQGFRILAAWGLSFLLMVSLRAFGAGLFRDIKEIVFVAPLVAILTGASLDEMAGRGRWGTFAAAASVLALLLFGLSRYQGYLASFGMPAW